MLLQVNSCNISFQGRNLKPLSEYKGPILKLTQNEKEQIKSMEFQIAGYELELEKLKMKSSSVKRISSEKTYYNDKIWDITRLIEELRQAIKDIKIKRLNIQKESCL